jgi:hypothetical protein
MQVADLNRKRKRKKTKNGGTNGSQQQRRSEKDPLQSFNGGDVNLDGLDGGDDDDGEFEEDMPDFSQGNEGGRQVKKQKQDESISDKKLFTNTRDGTGKSTAGRNAWKEKHRKGKFSSKKRMSERRQKDPLGI